MNQPANSPEPLTPQLLDIVRREADFAVYYDGRPLTTPAGYDVAHRNPRALGHLLREWTFSRAWDWDRPSAAALFRLQKDILERDPAAIPANFEERLKADPMVRRVRHGSAQEATGTAEALPEVMAAQDQIFLLAVGTLFGILTALNDLLLERGVGPLAQASRTPDRFAGWIREQVGTLPIERQAALYLMDLAHASGMLLPLLLILDRITASEYALALFAIHAHGMPSPAPAPVFPGFTLKPAMPDWTRPEASYHGLKAQAASIADYLRVFTEPESRPASLKDLIARGESFDLEFKASLRWNLKAGRNDSAIEHACLKTLAAFLNSAGGTLLIGVQDTGALGGIEADTFANPDKFALHFWNLVKASMGQDVTSFIRVAFESVDGHTVFRAQCARSHQPVFLRQSGFEEEFYIRVGPSSTRLTIQEALKYIPYRFGNQKLSSPSPRQG